MSEYIKYDLDSYGYAVITLNRPDKRNAISFEMAAELMRYIKQAQQDEVKFLVLTGAGDKMFCAGGDLNDLHGGLSGDTAFSKLYQVKEVLYELVTFPVPTICLLNGNALGGGCEIATACDFRIAKEATSFGFVQGRLGIVPGWGGGAILYEKIHHTYAYQLLLESDIYDASYLETRGWIHKIVSEADWEDRDKVLKPYIGKTLQQMKVFKKQYKKAISAISLSSQMSEEVRDAANLWGSEEHKQAVDGFMNK